jgi:hypothetical protein
VGAGPASRWLQGSEGVRRCAWMALQVVPAAITDRSLATIAIVVIRVNANEQNWIFINADNDLEPLVSIYAVLQSFAFLAESSRSF